MNLTPSDQYCRDILNGSILSCKYTKLAVERHVNDLEEGHKRGLVFNEKRAQLAIQFIQMLNHWDGALAGTNIKLEPHQQFYLSNLYGWYRKDGTKRYTSSYKEVARKNGKTTECGAKALFHMVVEGYDGSQVWSGATKKEQANIAVNDAGQIALKTPWLKSKLEFVMRKKKEVIRVIYPERNSFMAAIGRDSDTEDGLKPSMAVIDEFHAHPDLGVLEILESGMAHQTNPFTDIITTAGFNRNSVCYHRRASIINILEGKIQDDSSFGIIYTLDEEDEENYTDSRLWGKANPNLNVSVKLPFLIDRANKAKNEGGEVEVGFKTKNLNMWCDAANTWIQSELYNLCKVDPFPDLTGKECYGGLDLANTQDFCSFSLVFEYKDRTFKKQWFFLPEAALKRRTDKQLVSNINRWASEGYITITPGNTTDYGYIKKVIRECCETYKVHRIGFDKWNASDLVTQLTEEGIPMSPFSQSIGAISAPTKKFKKLILDKEFAHDGNPVSAWMLGNVFIKQDSNENIKVDKKESSEKVDEIVSTIMAIGELMTGPEAIEEASVEIW